jgi:hypothetical protein
LRAAEICQCCGAKRKFDFFKKTSQKGLTGEGGCPYKLPPRHRRHPAAWKFPRTNVGSEQFGNGIVRGNMLFDIVNIGRDAQAAA